MTSIKELNPQMPQALGGYLPSLDGWRAIAVTLVLLHHRVIPHAKFTTLTEFGGFGVEIFFGISGLLICSRLLGEREKSGSISLAGFYVRRSFRIFPAAWLYLGALCAMGLVGLRPCSLAEIGACLLFYRNVMPTTDSSFHWSTAHFWSLNVEEHFYLVFPFLLVQLRPKIFVWTLPFCSVAVVLWRSCDKIFGLSYALLGYHTYFRTDIRLDGLLWGCWVALVVWRHTWLEKSKLLAGTSIACAAIIIAGEIGEFFHYTYLGKSAVTSLCILLVLAGTVCFPTNWVTRLLELPTIRWLGRISYSVYLWQQIFGIKPKDPANPSIIAYLKIWPVNLLTLLLIASASYYLVEKPLIRLGHRVARSLAASSKVGRDEGLDSDSAVQ